mmetsp:Transcript_10195/g.11992  ORF Transcript_10195/g.11992 Transcript_10195/m.11992 type:complete len:94 (+) Transcript_10195:691-972(+)
MHLLIVLLQVEQISHVLILDRLADINSLLRLELLLGARRFNSLLLALIRVGVFQSELRYFKCFLALSTLLLLIFRNEKATLSLLVCPSFFFIV